jgi:inner membrane protein
MPPLDPITHTFTGAALAAAGVRRATPLATAALILGANAPDVDAVTYFADGFGCGSRSAACCS